MKYLLNTVQYAQYFASKYLKWTFEKKSYEIWSIKYVAGMKYLLNAVQQETFETCHMKSGPPTILFGCTIYLARCGNQKSLRRTLKKIA